MKSFFMGIKHFQSFMIERIISSDPDIIVIGICGTRDKTNNLSYQQIRINESSLAQLIKFEKTPTKLSYNFQRDISLHFEKCNDNKSITYTIIDPSQHINRTSQMDRFNIDYFKKFRCGKTSAQFDEIDSFIKQYDTDTDTDT